MRKRKIKELMNREIDGLNTPRESEKLRNYLRKNPEDKKLLDDLCALSGSLQEVTNIDPPKNLKKTILNSIDKTKYAQKEKKSYRFSYTYKFNFRYAYIFFAGLVLGVLMYYALFTSIQKSDNSHLIGTMIRNERPEHLETMKHLKINEDYISGSVDLKSLKDILYIEFNVITEKQIKIVMEFEQSGIDFLALRRINKNKLEFSLTEKTIQLHHRGNCNYFILLAHPDSGVSILDIMFFSDKNLLMEESFSLPKQIN